VHLLEEFEKKKNPAIIHRQWRFPSFYFCIRFRQNQKQQFKKEYSVAIFAVLVKISRQISEKKIGILKTSFVTI
jgi:hypothetical protein